MNYRYLLLTALLLLLTAVFTMSCEKSRVEVVTEIVEKLVPKDIDLKNYPHTIEEVAEHVEACGAGVVEDAPAECDEEGVCVVPKNDCDYTIKVDDLMLTHPLAKTGYIEDLKSVRQTAQFMAPTAEDLAAVPEAWDFTDLGLASQVKINRQRCGDCWSQATTKALEYMVAAHDSKLVDLSVQTQISRCSNYGSCNGGYMTAPNFVVKYGNPFEVQDPYKARNGPCTFTSAELNQGFEIRPDSAPWVGRSLSYSRFYQSAVRGNTAEEIKALMFKHQSPAIVTIRGISSSGGVIRRCSSINSGGNHMQAVVGWYQSQGDEIAKVNNSWGTNHGQNGFTHMKWECGSAGRLNRGLGRSARVYIYKPDCTNMPNADTGPDVEFVKKSPNHGVMIGHTAQNKQECSWAPLQGLRYLTADKCLVFASPDVTTEYHMTAKTECGEKTSMVLVKPLGPMRKALAANEDGIRVLTPLGEVRIPEDEL